MKSGRKLNAVNWRVGVALAVALCVSWVPSALHTSSAHAQIVRAPSVLIANAARQPNAKINVIVQRNGQAHIADALVRAAGGRITRNLSLINAFAATLPGRAVRRLALSQSVNWVSPDAVVHRAGGPDGPPPPMADLVNTYDADTGATSMWSNGYQGGGVNVAVIDSGVTATPDLGGPRLVAEVSVNPNDTTVSDGYGHGTHVAGIIAGNGGASRHQFVGSAPKAGIVSVKVFDSTGASTVSTVVSGLQWVFNNAARYNIKVVNLSLDSALAQSYNVDPLDAACEELWFSKIVVVVAAGNNELTSPGVITAPANDPFVITVGAIDDGMSTSPSRWTRAPFSTYGTTLDGYSKPDLSASGVDVVSILAGPGVLLAKKYPTHVVAGSYFNMSGTSMATPEVSAAAALLLEKSPTLTPDQVKQRLVSTATQLWVSGVGAGMVNAYAATQSTSLASANTGIPVSQGLQSITGNGISTWDSASWGSAYWGGTWSAAAWGSAAWGSASWGSASWGSSSWGSDYWGATHHHPNGKDGKVVPFGTGPGQSRSG